MAIEFIKQCQKEVLNWPDEVREDLADAITRLEARAYSFNASISPDAKYRERCTRTSIQRSLGYLPSNIFYN